RARPGGAAVDRPAAGERRARLELDPLDRRLAAVAEEEVVAVAVALDQVVDLVAVGVERERRAAERAPQGEIELQARLRIEVRIAGDEAASGGAAEVAVRERRRA